MNVVHETIYKGHEIIVIATDDSFIVDVRADDYDGDLIYGRIGFTTLESALQAGYAYIDQL
jgi:hypothetical protein